MFCESYRQALTEAACSGEALPRELATHLTACDACASAFAAEQTLFTWIDRSLRVTANSDAPPSLVPRVRAQIAAGSARTPWHVPVLAFATLLLVAGVIGVSPVLHWRWTPGASRGQGPIIAPVVRSADSHEAIRSLERSAPTVTQSSSRLEKVVARQARVHFEPEVLISPEEQAGLERYAARLRSIAVENSARTAVKSDLVFKIQPLEIAVMDLRQLSIEPLESDADN